MSRLLAGNGVSHHWERNGELCAAARTNGILLIECCLTGSNPHQLKGHDGPNNLHKSYV